ncbi:hypothetical protein ACFCX0_32380 [Streptomyces sp. NPDC056352]
MATPTPWACASLAQWTWQPTIGAVREAKVLITRAQATTALFE